MAQVKKQLTELIGHTPLLELERLEKAHNAQARIIAKLEYFNPGGSVKDRIALAMIEDAEKRGLLKEGATIIEPTSGNTGVGLAWVASVKGYKTILTMPETMSIERQNLLKALGAQLVLTPGSKGMSGAIEKANELRDNTPGAVILQQFENPANPRAHIHTTAQEIWEDMDGKVDVFIAGVGTGGTLSGVGEGLKQHNPQIEIIGVEPDSSAVLSGERPDVRCHQMSYQTLFTNRLSLSNFAKSESDNGKELTSLDHSTPQASRSNPTIGGFSVQANRASCVLVRQKVFCPTRTNLPAQRGGGIRSKVADSGREKSTNQKSHVYGENNRDKDGQKV